MILLIGFYYEKFFFLIILFFISSNLFGQVDPKLEKINFVQRYIKWFYNNDYYPTLVNPEHPDIEEMAVGFWDETFYIPFYVHSNMRTYLPTIQDALAAWNSGTNIIKFEYFGIYEGSPYDMRYGETLIFWDDFGVAFTPNVEDLEKLAETKLLVIGGTEFECSDNFLHQGPIANTNPIAMNPLRMDIFYEINNPAQEKHYLFWVIVHELGHVAGLGHHFDPLIDEALRSHIIPNTSIFIPASRDFNAINRLYGYDGLNNGGQDPFYSSIDCNFFSYPNSGFLELKSVPNDGTIGDVETKGCSNCVTDFSEEGIDCGGNCNTSCVNECTGTVYAKRIKGWEPLIEIYNVVQQWIEIGDVNDPTSGESTINIIPRQIAHFQAGDRIDIGPGFSTKNEAVTSFQIGDCNCPPICSPDFPNCFSPNGDGNFDALYMATKGVSKVECIVRNSSGKQIHSVTYNFDSNSKTNKILLWDGSNGVFNTAYAVSVEVTSVCDGSKKLVQKMVNVLNPETFGVDCPWSP